MLQVATEPFLKIIDQWIDRDIGIVTAGYPLHLRRGSGRQAPEVRIGLVEGEQRVILPLNDQRRRLDRRQDLLEPRLIQQRIQLGACLAGFSRTQIALTQSRIESTAQPIVILRLWVGWIRSPSGVGEQQ